jgi:altronate hydrolase
MENMVNTSKIRCLVVSSKDNVGVIVNGNGDTDDIVLLEEPYCTIKLSEKIRSGSKVAIKKIAAKSPVIKYGQVIGSAKANILPGQYVHTHNIKYNKNVIFSNKSFHSKKAEALSNNNVKLPESINAYQRDDGRIGIRNYVVVLSSSNCAASVVKQICHSFNDETLFHKKKIDGVIPITYGGGCALAIGGLEYQLLNRTIAGWIDHPNVVGAVIVGVGCEGINYKSILDEFLATSPIMQKDRLEFFNIQDIGGVRKSIQYGINKVKKIILKLPLYKRAVLPVSSLCVALNCGGSDSFSGLTANPALGNASDMIIEKGGTVVLGELPECHGAEDYLIERCLDLNDKKKLINIVHWWKKYLQMNHVTMNNNLSLGNMEKGISTILEKSLGAIMKGGTNPIAQVLNYAERVTRNGLILMDTPGFDPVSMTGIIAGGCNIGAFTTGCGSVYGCSIAPVIKISTNSEMYNRLEDDMDINAGSILENKTISDVGKEIYHALVRVANGEKTASEINGIGWEEFVPWPIGETL